jgi:alkylhydroperoxidase family enzyme
MARIAFVNPESASPEVKAAYEETVREHSISNMKAVLLHLPVALHAVLEWYKLFAQVKPFLGERLAILFCDGISRQNSCELCATFMHREIVKCGEDPYNLKLDEREQAVVDFGRQLAKNPNEVSDSLFAILAKHFTSAQIVDSTVFGALMIVNNIFNSALKIDLDTSLDDYRIDPEKYFS